MVQANSSRLRPDERDRLYFSPRAWLKLQWFCHAGRTEVGGFGISAAHNPLYVEDFQTLRQYATPVTVRFDDAAVADYFDQCVDRGLKPERFARLWLHTHPGKSAAPSGTDEETFARRFGACDWSLMAILSRTSQTYVRLAFAAGPGAQVELPVAVHWAGWPEELSKVPCLGDDIEAWKREYSAHVNELALSNQAHVDPSMAASEEAHDWWNRDPWSEELDAVCYEPVDAEEAYDFYF